MRLHYCANFDNDAVLNHYAFFPLSFFAWFTQPDLASLGNYAERTNVYGAIGAVKLGTRVDDGVATNGDEVRADQGGLVRYCEVGGEICGGFGSGRNEGMPF